LRNSSIQDVWLTALDAAGAKPPAGRAYDGRSLLPLLTGSAAHR